MVHERFIMKPQLALLGVGLCWAFTPVFVVAANWNPYGTIVLRAALSGIALLIFSGRASKEHLVVRPTAAAISGGIFGSLSTSLFAVAFLYTDPGKVYVLYYTFPIILLIVDSALQTRRIVVSDLGIVLAAFIGLLAIYGADLEKGRVGSGELIAFGSAIFWVLHIKAMKIARDDKDVATGNASGQIIIAGCFFPLMLSSARCPNLVQSGALFALGFFSFCALYLWSIAVRKVDGHLAGTITMLEAPAGVLLMETITGERPALSLILGGLLVLAAAAIAVRAAERE